MNADDKSPSAKSSKKTSAPAYGEFSNLKPPCLEKIYKVGNIF